MKNIIYIELTVENFFYNSLDNFKRHQDVKNCWRKVDNNYTLLPISYTEDWSLAECRKSAEKIIQALSSGSIAFGAINDDQIIGFALIINKRFGSENQYVDLAEFYVSEPYRKKALAKNYFKWLVAQQKNSVQQNSIFPLILRKKVLPHIKVMDALWRKK